MKVDRDGGRGIEEALRIRNKQELLRFGQERGIRNGDVIRKRRIIKCNHKCKAVK